MSTWPFSVTKVPRGNDFSLALRIFVICRLTAAQVAVLHVGIDIDNAADVVVVHDLHLMPAVDTGEVAQDLGIRRCTRRPACPALHG